MCIRPFSLLAKILFLTAPGKQAQEENSEVLSIFFRADQLISKILKRFEIPNCFVKQPTSSLKVSLGFLVFWLPRVIILIASLTFKNAQVENHSSMPYATNAVYVLACGLHCICTTSQVHLVVHSRCVQQSSDVSGNAAIQLQCHSAAAIQQSSEWQCCHSVAVTMLSFALR